MEIQSRKVRTRKGGDKIQEGKLLPGTSGDAATAETSKSPTFINSCVIRSANSLNILNKKKVKKREVINSKDGILR